jgi:hypothetical protein
MTNAQSRMWFVDARSGKVKKRTGEFVPAPATGSTDVLWSPTGAAGPHRPGCRGPIC